VNDDVIHIAQGIYHGNFTYSNTNSGGLTIDGGYNAGCTLKTVNSTLTVLDGDKKDNVLFIASTATPTIAINNLTVQNGGNTSVANSYGSGIRVNTSPSLIGTIGSNVSISTVRALSNKQGLVVKSYNAAVNGCFLNSNNATGLAAAAIIWGAAINFEADGVINVRNSNISVNDGWTGPFVYFNGGKAVNFIGNTVTNNTGLTLGGIHVIGGNPIAISKNTFSGNSTSNGLIDSASSGTNSITFFDHNKLTSNILKPGFFGFSRGLASFTNLGSTPTFIMANNLLAKNNTIISSTGGAIAVTTNSPEAVISVINNTITENTGTLTGGLNLKTRGNIGKVNLFNNIIRGNKASAVNAASADIYFDNDVDNDAIGKPVAFLNNNSTNMVSKIFFPILPSNINLNPQFVNTLISDYHLKPTSPMINQGINFLSKPAYLSKDIDGQVRQNGVRNDIGADEFYP
jgi:hypothetical protein